MVFGWGDCYIACFGFGFEVSVNCLLISRVSVGCLVCCVGYRGCRVWAWILFLSFCEFGCMVICRWIRVFDLVFVFGFGCVWLLIWVFAGLLWLFVICLLVCDFRVVGVLVAVWLIGGGCSLVLGLLGVGVAAVLLVWVS